MIELYESKNHKKKNWLLILLLMPIFFFVMFLFFNLWSKINFQPIETHKFIIDVPEIENESELVPKSDHDPNHENNFEIEDSWLERDEVFNLINRERKDRDISPLTENDKLNTASLMKIDDMFDKNYFAHTSPAGKEVQDLAEDVGYSYILIGENLAKGRFQKEEDLVDGWMSSPGHKENILKKSYEEAGLAIKSGDYMGNELLMAVQVFGTPSDSCPKPEEEILTEIEKTKEELKILKQNIDKLDEKISENSGLFENNYRKLIEARNELASKHNRLGYDIKDSIAKYNKQVEERNLCLDQY